MSDSSGSEYTCQLCEKTSSSKEDIVIHLLRHLGYRKYPCDGCALSFFSEAEREKHCTTSKHNHSFRVTINQYNEMLVSMLLKDMDLLKIHDPDLIVAQRAKLNAEFDSAIQSRSKPPKMKLDRILSANNTPLTPAQPKKSSLKATTAETPTQAKTPVEPVPVMDTPVAREPRSLSRDRKRQRRESAGPLPIVESQEPPVFGTASDAIDASLTTQIGPKAKCRLCTQVVASDYVSRKHHVSKDHMNHDHDDSDYVDLLENRMREAFDGMTYSDLQCQWGNCEKIYQSDSGRRGHFHSHFPKPLACPFEECVYQDVECNKIKAHLKECHNLPQGSRSMPNSPWRTAFEQAFKKQNRDLESVFEKCFPCSIPNSVKNPRSASRPLNPNKMTEVLRDIPRTFQRSFQPNLPIRRMSESSDSDDDDEKSAPKTPEVAKKAATVTPKATAKAGTSKDTSDSEEEEEVTEFAEDIKNVPLLKKLTKKDEAATLEREGKEKAKEKKAEKTAEKEKKKDETKEKEKKQAQEASPSSSDDDIVYLATKKNKKSRKVKEAEEIKKEAEQEEGMSFPSSISSVDNEKSLSTDEEVKEEPVVEKETKEAVTTAKEGDGGKRRNQGGEGNGSPGAKRHAPNNRRDRLSSTSKSDSRDRGEHSGWQQQHHHNQPKQRRVSHNEDHRNHRPHAPSRSRWGQMEEQRQQQPNNRQQERPWGCPPPIYFPPPPPPLRRPPVTGMRKKGSELNMSLDNPRPSYAIYTGHK